MRDDPIYLRGDIWWCRVRGASGRIERKSTKCRDREAAKRRWRELERESVSPADRAAHRTSLGDALDRRIAERRSAGRAEGTLHMLGVKARQLTRVLGSETPLARIDAKAVDDFIAVRLREGASRSTVHKEIVTLRGALRLAKRRGEYNRDVADVMPLDFSVKYKPRERALSEKEIAKLLAALPARRAAVVAFLLATGATYPSEVENLRKGDVDRKRWFVLLRGTKRESRYRRVPIVAFARPWLTFAMEHATGKAPAVFERWTNVRRDLRAACDAASIAKVSPNDLRRTLATLLRARGVEPSVIGQVLGHADSRMVEKVYGRITPEQLAHLLDERLAPKRARAQRRAG